MFVWFVWHMQLIQTLKPLPLHPDMFHIFCLLLLSYCTCDPNSCVEVPLELRVSHTAHTGCNCSKMKSLLWRTHSAMTHLDLTVQWATTNSCTMYHQRVLELEDRSLVSSLASVACLKRSMYNSLIRCAWHSTVSAHEGQWTHEVVLVHRMLSVKLLFKWHVDQQCYTYLFAHNTDTHNNLLYCVKLISADIFSPCSHERSVHFHTYF